MLLQKCEFKKLNDTFILVFLECICYIQILVIHKKGTVSQICVVPFSNFPNWMTFGSLREVPLSPLNCITHYRPHLRCCYYFASHKKIQYVSLLHLAWLISEKLGFTLFLPYSHKGCSASLVCGTLNPYSVHCERYMGNIV